MRQPAAALSNAPNVQVRSRNEAMRRLQTQIVPEAAVLLFVPLMTTQVPMFGPLVVLAQFGVLALLIAARPVQCLQTLLHWWPLLATPIIAIASFIWSDLPADSLRYACLLFFTAFVGVLLANLVRPRRFIVMSFIGMLIFCVLSILTRNQGASVHGPVLIGLTGSKNQMAMAGYTLMMAALGVLLDGKNGALMRLAAAPSILLGLFIVATTDSATAVLVAAASGPLLVVMVVAQFLPPAGRIGTALALVAMLSPLALIWNDINDWLSNSVLSAMGKDSTLTGRTHLWEIAHDLIARRPLQGYGYQAIWMGDSADTLGILRWAGISDGRTFSFHNTYLQVGVDTGYLGITALVVVLAAIALAGLRQFILKPTVATSYFYLNFLIIVVISMTDVVILPFLPRTMLLFACGVYALRDLNLRKPKQAKPQFSWRRRHQWT